jgi:tetratricopeptide (TPR) repeat protein
MKALPFFRQAVDLDPNFALAYNHLGVVYEVLGERTKSVEFLKKAFQLRDRVTEPENFFISTNYYYFLSGEIEKGDQVCDLWAQAYPRDPHPHLYLGYGYGTLGKFEKATAETKLGLQLDPDISLAYGSLIQGYALLNRLDEAKSIYQTATKHRPDFAGFHPYMYGVAFLQGDTVEMKRQASWAADKPGVADVILSYQSDTEAFFGRLAKARQFSQQAADFARRSGQKEMAATWQLHAALREAEFGNAERAHDQATSALTNGSSRDVQILGALALSSAGDPGRAQAMSRDLEREHSADTMLRYYWLPTINAIIAINRSQHSKAIEYLNVANSYELGLPPPNPEFGASLYPAFVRGQAYLLLHKGHEAAEEFQKFLDHRDLVANNPLFVLAHLGLARSYGLQSDIGKARAEYEVFFSLWRDADPDIPVLMKAKIEYARLP